MLHVTTWCWGDKYAGHYLERLERGVARHLKQEHRFHVCRPSAEDEHLTKEPGCLVRLRTFDPAWQAGQGIEPGDRIVCLDLDLIVTGALDDVFDRDEPFVILQGVNAVNPCPFNGSVWMLRAGYRPDVWTSFSPEAARAAPWWERAYPDDQCWFHHMMPDAGAFGPEQGVYAFMKPGWNGHAESLPANAKIVAFPGHRDPSQFTNVGWVKHHWAA